MESIFLGLPVVTCSTGGIPYLNKDGETVLISEPGDIDALAINMKRLLFDPELSTRLSKNALAFVMKEFDSRTTAQRFVNQYKAIILHYWDKQPIDEALLFDKKSYEISS